MKLKAFFETPLLIVCLGSTFPSGVQAAYPPEEAARLIQAAGNTSNEIERWRHLKELEAVSDLSAILRSDLNKLLPVVNDWANGKEYFVTDSQRAAENGYLCKFFTGKVKLADAGSLFPPEVSSDSPLYPIWCLYRGRMLIWQVIQSGPLLRVKESREAYYGEGRRLLEIAHNAFPENAVAGMYLGQPIAWPRALVPCPAAPEWANLQREGLEKLAEVIHWWIAERQLPDGQFGGGWGDDVEMWRWWIPVLIGFEDPLVTAAQERISNGIFQQPHMQAGFTSRVTDVEHSNEDTTDTILPMMHLQPDDPVWQKRARRLAELMRDLWTGRNQRGRLQFKSIYFSVDRLDLRAERAFDTVYHPSVIQPALLYWQRTGDAKLTQLFSEWLRTWVDIAARQENGKPAGVLPSVIRWPEGTVGAADKPWWEPFSPGHNDALYNWPGAARLMTSTLLLANHMTGDEQFLQPLHSMAQMRLRFLDHPPASKGTEGSEDWSVERYGGFLPETLAKYRFLTNDTQYDRWLQRDASGYIQFRLTRNSRSLINELRKNAEAFRSNWEGYTSEMRWTDRVISFTRNYLRYLPEPAPPAPNPQILYSMATGDPGTPWVFPLNAVRWLTLPRDIAALVADSSRTHFVAELFHFGTGPRSMGAEFYLLEPGRYKLSIRSKASGRAILEQLFEVEHPRHRLPFELPPRELVLLEVKPE